jgi:signal transduction histidine kinase
MSTESRSSDNQVVSKSTRLLEENALTIHKWLLFSVAIFSLVFSFISVLLGDYTQAWISVLSVPGVCIAYMLMRMQLLYLSKLFNAVQIIVIITSISLLTGINSLSFMFFFPVIVSVLMAFKENEKKTAFSLVTAVLLILILLTAIAYPIGKNHWNPEHLFLDRLTNIIGVALSCILIIYLLIKTMNKVQGQLIVNTNILIENNNQLLAARFSRDQLMSVIAHDLRAPMAGAIMTTEACLKEGISDETKNEMLRTLHIKARSILTMTDQLLDWSRSQTGNLQCNMDLISMKYIDSNVRNWTMLIGETKNIHFNIEIKFDSDETVLCDKNMIVTTLRNLISNAVKFSAIDSIIKIRSQKIGVNRSFEVEDFGRGLNSTQLKKLREGISFTTPGTNNEKGNGFGLQLVQEFLRRHKSHLEIKSVLGKGSVFSFNL